MANMCHLKQLMKDMSKYTVPMTVSRLSMATLGLIIIVIVVYGIATELDATDTQKSKYNMVPLSANILINCCCLVLQFEFAQTAIESLCMNSLLYTFKTDANGNVIGNVNTGSNGKVQGFIGARIYKCFLCISILLNRTSGKIC